MKDATDLLRPLGLSRKSPLNAWVIVHDDEYTQVFKDQAQMRRRLDRLEAAVGVGRSKKSVSDSEHSESGSGT